MFKEELFDEAMVAPVEALNELSHIILNENDVQTLLHWSDRLDAMRKIFETKSRALLRLSTNEDLVLAFVDMFDAAAAKCAQLADDAEHYAEMIEDEMENDKVYGSYEEQVRSQYYEGKL